MDKRGAGVLVRALGLVGQLGFTLTGGIAAGLGVGWLLDNWLGTRAVFKVMGIFLGLAGGGFTAYRLLSEFLREAAKHDAKRNEAHDEAHDGKRNDGE